MGAWRDFPIPDGSYSDETRPFSQQDVVNYLPTLAERDGTRSPVVHKTAPGLKTFTRIGTGPHRGAHNCEGRRFIVSGRKLYQVDKNGVATDRGTIPGTGRVTMAHNQIANGNQVLIGTIDNSYLWDTVENTLAATGVALQSVDFLNQRFLGVDQQRRFWRHSALADGASWSDLDVYSSESSPDRIVALKVLDGQVYVFNERTIEVFVDQPTETQVFQRTVVIQRGCISGDTIVRIAGTLFFVGDDYIPYRLDGYTPVPIGMKPIVADLSKTEPRKLFGFGWEDRGYLVYYVTAQNGHTWGYDVTNGRWHRRESYGLDRWRINTLVKFEQDWYAGDYSSGLLYRLEWGYVYEGCEIMPRKLRTGVLHNQGNRVRVNGVKLIAETGKAPSIPISVSQVYTKSKLLVTGQAPTTGAPVSAYAISGGTLSFTGIPTASGADVSSGSPFYYGGAWVVVGSNDAVLSTDNLQTWQSIAFPYQSFGPITAGPDGWIALGDGSASAYDQTGKSKNIASGFTPFAFSSVSTGAVPSRDHAEEAWMCRYTGENYYFDVGARGELVKTSDIDMSSFVVVNAARDFGAIYDIIEFGGDLYVCATIGTNVVLAKSTDGGVTFPEILVTEALSSGNEPMQLEAFSGTLIVLCRNSANVYTSKDGFAEKHSTGIRGDFTGAPVVANMTPRRIACGVDETGNGYFYIVSTSCATEPSLGNKCVFTTDGIAFSEPVSTGLVNTAGIASSFDNALPSNAYAPCDARGGGFFQLRYSNDGGYNYSDWRNLAESSTGGFMAELVARRLGMARHRVWEIMDTSDAAQDVLAASIIVESE